MIPNAYCFDHIVCMLIRGLEHMAHEVICSPQKLIAALAKIYQINISDFVQ